MPRELKGWEKVWTSIPPGMRKLLDQRAREDLVDPATVIRTALKKYLGYDVAIHEHDENDAAAMREEDR